jgi:hypothetical protein
VSAADWQRIDKEHRTRVTKGGTMFQCELPQFVSVNMRPRRSRHECNGDRALDLIFDRDNRSLQHVLVPF